MRTVSVIVPTYKEVENIPLLAARLEKIRHHFQNFEVLIMDDNSQDGSDAVVKALNKDWLKLMTRTHNRGLSPAVLDGFKIAKGEVLITMDADLSHPPEVIPEMVKRLESPEIDFVLGSRYVAGGQIDQEWTWFRYLNSKVATLMARPLTKVKDPMSGFFAIRRKTYENADALNPIGYKIALEMMVKGRCRNVVEVPIHFADRIKGESKLSLKEQMKYIRHLARLFQYKFLSARA